MLDVLRCTRSDAQYDNLTGDETGLCEIDEDTP